MGKRTLDSYLTLAGASWGGACQDRGAYMAGGKGCVGAGQMRGAGVLASLRKEGDREVTGGQQREGERKGKTEGRREVERPDKG